MISHRSELFRMFENYKMSIISIYDLDNDINEQKQKLSELENNKQIIKDQLPKEIIDLYEQQCVVWRLKGENSE